MKLRLFIPVGILLLLSVATLSAQTTLANPNDDSCWSSLSALRACQLQASNEAADQAQRCTSYPEFQCLPPETSLQKTAAKHSPKASQSANNKANNNTIPAVSPVLPIGLSLDPPASNSTGNSK